jgi:ribosomal protein S18 acetylase RimI-like enzyme
MIVIKKIALRELLFADVYRILKDAFFEPTPKKVKKALDSQLNSAHTFAIGAFRSSELLGLMLFDGGEDVIHLEYIGVDANHRNEKVGSRLIQYVLDHYNLPLTTETDSGSLGFYEKNGFSTEKTIKKYGAEDVVRFFCKHENKL